MKTKLFIASLLLILLSSFAYADEVPKIVINGMEAFKRIVDKVAAIGHQKGKYGTGIVAHVINILPHAGQDGDYQAPDEKAESIAPAQPQESFIDVSKLTPEEIARIPMA